MVGIGAFSKQKRSAGKLGRVKMCKEEGNWEGRRGCVQKLVKRVAEKPDLEDIVVEKQEGMNC